MVALCPAAAAVAACQPGGGGEAPHGVARQAFGSQHEQVLYADGATDDSAAELGSTVALRGPTAFIGAPRGTATTFLPSGVVYVLERSATWSHDERLEGSDAVSLDLFGSALAVAGADALVGAPAHQGTGAVYAFSEVAASWSEIDKLVAFDAESGADFGRSVALDGATALVGAPLHDEGGEVDAGAVYVFGFDGSSWVFQEKLPAPAGSGVGGHFGAAVALAGDLAIVGAPGEGPVGAAHVYERVGGNWGYGGALPPPAQGARFGQVLRLRADRALVSAVDPAATAPGAAFLYQRNGSVWTPTDLMVAAPPDGFGLGIALGDDIAFVGAPYAGADVGTVAVFTYAGGGWTHVGALDPQPASAGARFGAAVGSDRDLVIGGAPSADGALGSALAGRAHALLLFGQSCASGSECALGHCVDGVCCESACPESCMVCDRPGAEGSCALAPDGHAGSGCGLYLCNGADDTCPTSCSGDGDCAPNAYCDGSTCVPRLADATPCSADNACLSGHCVEDICCSSACERGCASCTLPGQEGTCSPLAQGSAGEPACVGFVCDGVGLDCPAACLDNSACPPGTVCNPAGECTDEPFCDGGYLLINSDGSTASCAPYACVDPGSCRGRCDSTADCSPGNICLPDSSCGPPDAPPPPEDDGGCAITGPRAPRPWAPLLLAALAFAARRRRAHSTSSSLSLSRTSSSSASSPTTSIARRSRAR
jgi:hypothetical protein